jgi:hypothetical protein
MTIERRGSALKGPLSETPQRLLHPMAPRVSNLSIPETETLKETAHSQFFLYDSTTYPSDK